ncbi:MAG: hypothetical protein U0939_04730 [Pirellulales bacterium]
MVRQMSALSCVLWFVGALHADQGAPAAGRVVGASGTAVAPVEPNVVERQPVEQASSLLIRRR